MVRVNRSTLGHDSATCNRSPEVSSIAFHAQPPDLPPVPLMEVGFAITCPLARHRRPQIQFLSIGSRVCSALLSDLASRLSPCASLSLRLHQAVKRTFTSKLSTLLGTQENGRSETSPRPENHIQELVAIVIVVVPIAFRVPAVAVFVPPAMALVPAVFPRFTQFVAGTIRLLTLPTVMLHGFVQFVVRLGDAALATMVVIRKCTGRPGEGQHAGKQCRGEYRLSKKPIPSRLKVHVLSILPYSPWLEWGQVLSYNTRCRSASSIGGSTP